MFWRYPLDLTERLWPMKKARPFVVLAWVLATPLVILVALVIANNWVKPLSLYTRVVEGRFFEWVLIADIVALVLLLLGLAFVASTRSPAPNKKQDGWVQRAVLAGIGIVLVILGVRSGSLFIGGLGVILCLPLIFRMWKDGEAKKKAQKKK